MTVLNISARNVNEALPIALMHFESMRRQGTGTVAPRGMPTLEIPYPVATTYHRPLERVLFLPQRDANPFFHLMEALWILAGRNDVATLTVYNKRMGEFSDDGTSFHAPYGYRLRRTTMFDQLDTAVELIKRDPDTRRAVLQIWDADMDLGRDSKDIPCNDLIFLKARNGALHMRVLCRSNDAIWGAYGANAVQFSVLLEYLAARCGLEVGTYTQFSDSFHVYLPPHPGGAVYDRLVATTVLNAYEYERGCAVLYPMVHSASKFDAELADFWMWWSERHNGVACPAYANSFLARVATPAVRAWDMHKAGATREARLFITAQMTSCDWKLAMTRWLDRRAHKQAE